MNVNTPIHADGKQDQTVPWGAVLCMALCSFTLVSSEFMPVSLLTPIASTLSMSEGQAGQVISVSGFFAVLTSLFLSTIAGDIDRKLLLLILTGMMVASGFLVAFAPDYWMMMFGRAILGVSIGGVWSMSTAVIVRIVPTHAVAKAIALLQGGSALATAVAAPIGSFLGGMVGWRGAFFCIVPVAAIVLIWQAFSLPSLPSKRQRESASILKLLSRFEVVVGAAAVGLLFMGQFALFTYLRPFLETVTHVDIATLSILLLIIGVSGLVGTTLVGRIIERNLSLVVILIPILMAIVAALLLVFGQSLIMVAILLGAWGLFATPAPVGWFTWLSRTMPEDMEAGGGLLVAIIQLAITLGATIGGVLYDTAGYQATFLCSAIILAAAGCMAVACTMRRTARVRV